MRHALLAPRLLRLAISGLILATSCPAEAVRYELERAPTPADCGDAIVDAGESCDDGNHVNGDGCDADCHVEKARLGWWKPVFAFPDTHAIILREFAGVAPGGPVAVFETSFDVFQAQLFDPATGALLHTFPEVTAWRAAVIAGDVWVAASGSPAVVNRYDGSTFALRQSYIDPNPNGGGGAFGGALALVGDHVLIRDVVTHTVEVFDAATGAHERALEDPGTGNPVDFGASIVAVAGQAVIGGNGLAYVFDPATGAYLRTLTGENGAAFDGARLVVLGDRVLLTDLAGGLVYVVSPATGEVLHTFLPPGNPDPTFGRYLAVLGDAVLIAGTDAVHVFDAATYARRRTIRDPQPHGCFGYTMFDTPFGFAISDVCAGEDFNGIVYVFGHDDGALVAALPDEGGGDSESGTRAVGAYGTTLLVWHQEDESGANSAVLGYRPCADGVLEPGEECDDDNLESGDGCDLSCTVTRCGNGIVTTGEECDDGNRHPGDGCENDCTVSQLVCPDSVRIENARLVMRHLGDPAGDETFTLDGRLVPPSGTTLDPLAAAATGAQVWIEDANHTRIVDLTTATAIIPPGARGTGCGPSDGWRIGKGRAVYANASNALDAACTPGSAQGLRRLEVRRRMHDGGIGFRVLVGPSPLVEPAGPLKIVIALGATSDASAGACGATFAPLPCERNARGTALVCR